MTNKHSYSEREDIIIKLVDRNKHHEDHKKCGANISCALIQCHKCPLNRQLLTIGDVRKMDPREKPEKESPPEPVAPIEGVREPSHYALFDGIEAIEIIARSMTTEQFRGYILGTVLKYRLRAGKKQDLAYAEKDLAKADFFKELYEKHKGLCYDAK